MKTLALEWVEKAEGDYAIMEREGRVREQASYDGICFHAQQCAEKYLKARLIEANIEFGKTHDLSALLDSMLPAEPLWEKFRRDLAYLSDFAVAFRYPGDAASREQAKSAIKLCRTFRSAARRSLNLAD